MAGEPARGGAVEARRDPRDPHPDARPGRGLTRRPRSSTRPVFPRPGASGARPRPSPFFSDSCASGSKPLPHPRPQALWALREVPFPSHPWFYAFPLSRCPSRSLEAPLALSSPKLPASGPFVSLTPALPGSGRPPPSLPYRGSRRPLFLANSPPASPLDLPSYSFPQYFASSPMPPLVNRESGASGGQTL